MTKPRSKVSLEKSEIETQAELLETVAAVAREMLVERDLKNAMDTELQEVRDKYQVDLAAAASFIEGQTELVAEYCTQHPDLFPKDRKSLDLTHAVVGFRTGMPKVKLLKRWKMEAVLAAVKARKWFHFIRSTEELDKEAVIARQEVPDDLASVGLEVVQAESFFIEPKLEEQTAGVKTEV